MKNNVFLISRTLDEHQIQIKRISVKKSYAGWNRISLLNKICYKNKILYRNMLLFYRSVLKLKKMQVDVRGSDLILADTLIIDKVPKSVKDKNIMRNQM